MSRARRQTGLCRKPQREPRCERVTALMRELDSVPPFAVWRVSWLHRRGDRDQRVSAYLLTDVGARGWCLRQGIAFEGDAPAPVPTAALAPAPTSCAHDPDYGDHVIPARSGEAAAIVDFKARGAGEEA